jgi:hypothetical protein
VRGLDRDFGGESDYGYDSGPSKPPPYEPGPPKKKPSRAILYVGILIMIIGLVIAAVPLMIGDMKGISNDWVGTSEEGYYGSYFEGDRTSVAGEITGEYPLDSVNDSDLWGMGYRYCYELDNVWDECPVAKEDMGEVGDRVMLNMRLRILTIDGYPYWYWTVTSGGKEDNTPFYLAAVATITMGLLVAIVGAGRYGKAKREYAKPSSTYSRTPSQTSTSRGAPERTRLEKQNLCKHCYSEMPLGEMICPSCGKSKFDDNE